MKELWKKLNLYSIAEGSFLGFLGLYLLFLVRGTNTFYIQLPDNSENTLFIILTIIAIFKSAILIWKDRDNRKFNIILLGSAVLVYIVYYMVYHSDQYVFLKCIGIITLGLIGTDYNKTIKLYAIVLFLMISTIVIASMSGLITNFIYFKDGRIRSSGGFGYPTDFAAYLFYLSVMAWIGFKKVPEWVFLILGGLVLAVSYFICFSVTGIICSTLYIMVVLVHWLLGGFIEKGPLSWLVSAALPVFAIGSVATVYLYSKGVPIAYKIDRILSARVTGAYEGLKSYGLTLFGTPFRLIGNGGSTFASNEKYNFVDNSYMLIMLRYGIVLLIVISILWPIMTIKATKLGDWRLAYGLALVAFHSLSEHHFPELNFNILLALPFSIIGFRSKEEVVVENKSSESDKKTRLSIVEVISSVITLLLFSIAIFFIGPRMLAWVRTIWALVIPIEIKSHTIIISIVIMLLVAFSILLVYSSKTIIYNLLCRTRVSIKYICVIACAGLLSICVYIGSGRLISRVDSGYIEYIDKEATVLNIIKDATEQSGGRLYTSEWPVLYYREYGGFSRSFLQGEELARYDNITVIMDSNNDSKCFFGQGFLYMDISGLHCIYTNNDTVVNALQDSGYHCTGYHSKKRYVNNVNAATVNELKLAEDGSVELLGPNESLLYGPSMNLRNGKYTVSYSMYLPETPDVKGLDENSLICTLGISNDWGNNVVSSTPVYYGQFDENGECTINVKKNIHEMRGADFSVVAEDGVALNVREITCQKTPDKDIHTKYDDEGRKIREEFYNIDGTPYEMPEGYYSVEYEYDKEDRINLYKYYGADGKPIATNMGYYQLEIEYNYKSQITRENYLDSDGNIMNLESGQASVEYEYDKAGNKIVQRYKDVENSLVMIEEGYAELHREYNDDKQVAREEYYDVVGNFVMLEKGYAAVEYEYDDAGNKTAIRYFGIDGTPIMLVDNYSEVHKLYNGVNKVVREEYYGTDGKPTIRYGGYFAKEHKYDNDGNDSVQTLYDTNGKRIVGLLGYAETKKIYDANDRIIRQEYYDTEGNPLTVKMGYFAVEYVYNEEGYQSEVLYYNIDNKPASVSGDYSICKKEYDDNGNLVSQVYYDDNKKIVTRSEGFCKVGYEYDKDGKRISETYYDISGKMVNRKEGYSVVRYVYDEKGRAINISYFDVDGKPVETNDNYYGINRQYDDNNQVIREEYLDRDGSVIIRSNGFSMADYVYDAAGNKIEKKCLDEKGKPVVNSLGFYRSKYEYDDGRRIIKESYYDLSDKLVSNTDGYAIMTNSYDKYGTLLESKYFNENRELVKVETY